MPFFVIMTDLETWEMMAQQKRMLCWPSQTETPPPHCQLQLSLPLPSARRRAQNNVKPALNLYKWPE